MPVSIRVPVWWCLKGGQARLEARFQAAKDVRQRQRLQALLLATTGEHGCRDIARIVGCSTSTFALWLNNTWPAA